MSGYDFLSGFLGNIGQQMQDKQKRQQDIEDEDRQYQRTLSREEALAASRERQVIAAEKRQRKNTPPKSRQFADPETGALMQEEAEYFNGKWHSRSKATPVPVSVRERVKEDGYNVDIMTNNERIRRGRTDAYMTSQAAGARASNSNAAKIRAAEISAQSAQSAGNTGVKIPTAQINAVAAALKAFDVKKAEAKAIEKKSLGLDPLASDEAARAALRKKVNSYYTEEAYDPKATASEQADALAYGVNKLSSLLGGGQKQEAKPEPSKYPDFAEEIAKGRKMFAGGDEATEDEIIEALIEAKVLTRK